MSFTSTIILPTATAAPEAPTSPPIVDILRFAASSALTGFGVLFTVLLHVIHALTLPISVVYVPLAYILAPVYVFLAVLLDAFILTPFSLGRSALQSLYPLYVFVGVSCICAGIVGLVARGVVSVTRRALFSPDRHDAGARVHPTHAVRSASQVKPRKRVSIKEERR